ncbi:DUF4937 domain-containing protein [Streptomyces nogalater]
MLVKWIRCTVVDRRGFERGQRKWAGLPGEPGFRGQGGAGAGSGRGGAHLRLLGEPCLLRLLHGTLHDRLAAAQSGTFKDAQVKLFEYRFDVKTGFEPRFTDADLIRVALCTVREERVEHFTLMQEKVWNPAMAARPA